MATAKAKTAVTSVNDLVTKLLAPFDDSVISTRLMNPNRPHDLKYNKYITSVAPEHYRRRFLEVLGKYDFDCMETVEGTSGVKGKFSFYHEDLGRKTVMVYEPWTIGTDMVYNEETHKRDKPNPRAGKPIDMEYTYAMLDSAAYKAVGRNLGIGLHLYLDKAENEAGAAGTTPAAQSVAPAAANNAAPAASSGGIANYDPEWDGSELCNIGKHKDKGVHWGDEDIVDAGYLSYITKDPAKANKQALKEIARRQHAAGAGSAANAAAAVADMDDCEVPF